MSIVVESSLAHATSVVHTVQVVVILAPAHLLGRGGNGLHVVAEDSLIELRSLLNLTVLVLGGAGDFLVVVSEYLIVSEVRAFFLVFSHGCLGLGHVGLHQLEVRVFSV